MSKNIDIKLLPIKGMTIPQLKEYIKTRIDSNFKPSGFNKTDLINYIKEHFEPVESDFLKAALGGTRDDYEFIRIYNKYIDPYIAVMIIQNAASAYYDNVGSEGKEIIRYIVNLFKNDIHVLNGALYTCKKYNSSLCDYIETKINENYRPATPIYRGRGRSDRN